MRVTDRFLRYVSYDTQSKPDVEKIPSTDKQLNLARALVEEMKAIGIEDAHMSEMGYVYGSIPANIDNAACLGFIAHMDTSFDASGRDVLPRIVENYDGSVIVLNDAMTIAPGRFPSLMDYVGQDIIVTDGKTLLGADDKAGIAEILTMAELLINDPSIRHGRIAIGFTPDEEVGHGADGFDVKGFGADFAYTVDGGALGELEYENFNAASANLVIHGCGIHPGSAKDAMVNALHVGQELDAMLPYQQRPEYTEGYEGFFHLHTFSGDVVAAEIHYIIRDHDKRKFEAKKELLRKAAEFIDLKYGKGTVELTLKDSYYNMKDALKEHMQLIDTASEAMRAVGVEPRINPVRGGTDGARLSYMGLPCPNLCTGGHNFHGVQEFIPVQSMEKIVDILVEIVRRTYA